MKRQLLRIAVSIAATLLLSLGVNAQQTVHGFLSSRTGDPLPGATITVKGTSISTMTDAKGGFSINASPGNTLVISYVGYQTREISISSNANLKLSLTPVASSMNEVVVIGYGAVRKKDLTGAVATISAKDFQKGVMGTPEQLIAGKVAGVSVTSNNGRPGAGSTIRIRGGASLSASNDPLIVIDGVPVENGNIPGASNALSFINPNDIESFNILKDASATAIYGTRASNGVIIITTKKGTSGKFRVNFTTTNSLSQVTRKVDNLSSDQLRSIVNAKGTDAQKAMLGGANTNWQDVIYQTAHATDNNISFSGGLKNFPYRLSLGYLNQTGVLITDKLQRTSANLSLTPSLFNNHLKVKLNVQGSAEKARFANGSAIGTAVTFDPTQPIYNPKSTRFGGYFEWLDSSDVTGLKQLVGRNPLGLLKQRFDESTPIRSLGNLQLDYSLPFLPELHANLNVGYDVAEGKGTITVSDSAASDYIVGGKGGQRNHYKTTRNNSLLEAYLNYVTELKSIHSRIDAMAGYSYNHYLTTGYNYPSFYYDGTKVPSSDPAFPTSPQEHTLLSYFGRINYSLRDRYLLTVTMRRDGSSRFGPDFKWGNFPSAAFAWNMKEESFLNNNKIISNMKLRLGYGITGQQDIGPNYAFLSVYGLSATNAAYQFGNNYYQMYRPGGYNPNIKWEQTATYNAGLDYGFINNRINGSIDVYYKKTKDLLNSIPQPAGSNFSAFFIANVGNMENKGIEFSINAEPVRNKNFTWDVNYNITYNKNKITNLTAVAGDTKYRGVQAGGISGGVGGGFSQIQAVGYPLNTFNLFKQVYDSIGNPVENVFVDKNEDGIINQDDFYKTKSATPNVLMGFSTNLTYKKWNAGFVLRANFNNYVYNNVYSNNGSLLQILGNYVLYNASANYLETKFIGNSNNLLSDYFLQNGSFLKMDNLYAGYNFGKIDRHGTILRLSAIVQNVFVITNYKGLDPEVSSGVDNNLYPRPRTYSLAISLNF